MEVETKEQLLERRFWQIQEGVTEAIRKEVAWLNLHRFPVWICDENGEIVDAAATESPDAPSDG